MAQGVMSLFKSLSANDSWLAATLCYYR